ncbi:D-glutamate cyclase, mitochondrial isoform X2 [Takifugu rubripes]|uniref:D-glutamate cyclase n=2 Tax=Takifugu rubripes TaxID=31033 RepID=A0A674NQ61_TAKRU|nr:D-glutamate cyclase, mitochondrial isoform X1 [Takifugu rubripes]XP_029688737.1 D-glutamate cyclase, mitochondrial isoform X2 [Takifugu rubripes]
MTYTVLSALLGYRGWFRTQRAYLHSSKIPRRNVNITVSSGSVRAKMEQSDNLKSLTPAELRLLIRSEDPRIRNTTGLANGYQQANVIILPDKLADDFEEFCQKNPVPLPLLYRSKSGQSSCPPLAKCVDIRTDISEYNVYENGKLVKTISNLQSYSSDIRSQTEQNYWSSMVSFYLGCSFGFEGSLKEAGIPVRNVEQGTNVSMYKTSLFCVGAGVFRCPLVVTMRPIPSALLDAAVNVTHLNPLAHGAPVHIGDPAFLGIQDLSKPDYGECVDLQTGDVTVFWACGVTAIEAILSSKPSLAFSHSPGCMFLSDIQEPSINPPSESTNLTTSEFIPRCFLISHNPLLYSLASQRAVNKIRKMEKIIGEDPGQRGIKALFVEDELLLSCLALSHASSVAITTGFPTHYMYSPPDETDGPPGAIAMASMLLSLGKKVTIITDRRAVNLNRDIINECVKKGILKTTVPLVTFEDCGADSALQFLCHNGDPKYPRFDHLVAIERSGRAADGNYYNMRGINIKHLVDPIDDLFIAAKNIPGIMTTGIGDGGNELGMGKLKDKVKAFMTNGKLIACDVPADYAITAGVSNWGGYALTCGLYLLNSCPSHRRYLTRGLLQPINKEEQFQDWASNLPSVIKEELLLAKLMSLGVRSGKTGHLAMEVDGLTFHPTHSDIITRLLKVTHDE